MCLVCTLITGNWWWNPEPFELCERHTPGEMSGQIPNQAGSQLSGLTQLNGNALPHQMPPLGGVTRSTIKTDPEFLRARTFIQDKM